MIFYMVLAMLLHPQQQGIRIPHLVTARSRLVFGRAFHSALPSETAALRPSIHLRGGSIFQGFMEW